MAHKDGSVIDPRSGFCKATSIFHSKRSPVALPPNPSLDIATFISSQSHNGKIAYIDAITGHKISFVELWHAVHAVSSCLSNMGIHKGDIILILSSSSIYFPVLVLSVLSIGAIITTANPLNTPQELHKQIKDSKPALAFTITQLVPKLSGTTFPIVLLDDPPAIQIHKESRIMSTLAEMMKKKPSGKRVKEEISQDDTAALLYSSGTTGVPKGVIHSHGNFIAAIQMQLERFGKMPKDRDVKFLSILPMFHLFGLQVLVLVSIAIGATVVVLPKYEFNDMMSAIQKYKVTYLPLVPPVIVTMVKYANKIKAEYDLSSLKWMLGGGAPTSKELIGQFLDRYPMVEVNQWYASTESNGAGAWTDDSEGYNIRYGTAGWLSVNTEAKVVDPDTEMTLGVNQKGELWLRGPTIMKGYFNNPEETAATLDSERWLKTGDLCYIDDDGFLFVVDRLKELIKYKAFQVAPAELEALLISHPEISDAAVIPFPDNDVGQYPMAYVVRKAGSNLSEKAIMDFVAKQVAPYKKVRKVSFISSVPKNPSGKILRRDLRNLATSKL